MTAASRSSRKETAEPHARQARGSSERSSGGQSGKAIALAHATLPAWLNAAAIIGFIFGGCCANVFWLEAIVKEEPGSGNLLLEKHPQNLPFADLHAE